MTTQELIKIAMEAYDTNTIYPHDGDTLALFVEREIGDAEGDPDEAERMMMRAIVELEKVRDAMVRLIN